MFLVIKDAYILGNTLTGEEKTQVARMKPPSRALLHSC